MSGKKTGQIKKQRAGQERRNLQKRELRKAKHVKEMQETASSRVSYVKKPFAERSLLSIGIGGVSLVLFFIGIYRAVMLQGQAGLDMAAVGFCSILTAVVSLWYGATSFIEKEKNYILAKIGIVISTALLLAWLIMIF